MINSHTLRPRLKYGGIGVSGLPRDRSGHDAGQNLHVIFPHQGTLFGPWAQPYEITECSLKWHLVSNIALEPVSMSKALLTFPSSLLPFSDWGCCLGARVNTRFSGQ